MACLYPGIRVSTPGHSEGDQIVFTRYDVPYRGKVHNGGVMAFGENADRLRSCLLSSDDYSSVACGKCIRCRLRSRKEWALRLAKEAELYPSGHTLFLTLTYDDDHLPWCSSVVPSSIDGELHKVDVNTLRADHMKTFFKDLRRWYDYHYEKEAGVKPLPLRQYHCGEYGSQTDRAHYHAILYGLDPKFLEHMSKTFRWGFNGLKVNDSLSKIWDRGRIVYGQATFEGMQYVSGYVVKKKIGLERDNDVRMWNAYHDISDDVDSEAWEPFRDSYRLRRPDELRELPFAHGSNRPGIAHDWYMLHKDEIYAQDELFINSKKGVQRVKPVAYFDRLFDVEDPERMEEIKEERKLRAETLLDLTLENNNLNEKQYQEMQIRKSEGVADRVLKYRSKI